jgi:hypothetical protein
MCDNAKTRKKRRHILLPLVEFQFTILVFRQQKIIYVSENAATAVGCQYGKYPRNKCRES